MCHLPCDTGQQCQVIRADYLDTPEEEPKIQGGEGLVQINTVAAHMIMLGIKLRSPENFIVFAFNHAASVHILHFHISKTLVFCYEGYLSS